MSEVLSSGEELQPESVYRKIPYLHSEEERKAIPSPQNGVARAPEMARCVVKGGRSG
jgi:hypothetical protein